MKLTKKQIDACRLTENLLRTLGNQVEIIITPEFVQVADTSWPGASTDDTLAGAIQDAIRFYDDPRLK